MLNRIRVERKIGDQVLSMETGALAKQASGACLVQYGETVTLSAVATGPARPGHGLLSAHLRLPRAARRGRQVSRRLHQARRPAHDQGNAHCPADRSAHSADVPRRVQRRSSDSELRDVERSANRWRRAGDERRRRAALCISPLPFQGPLGSVRLGLVDGQFVPFPTQDELEASELDLIVSGTRDAVLMIEGFSRELPEDRDARGIMAELIATSASCATCSRS